MNGDLWIAVGKETGNWDDLLTHPEQFLGVALVIAKVSDWKSALTENLKAQSIEQRMKHALQNLPKENASDTHRVIDALNYFKTQSVRGLWTLDKMVKGNSPHARLKNELSANLNWLATHPQLITIGTYGKAEWLINNVPLAHMLQRTYGLLAALILPFLATQDKLLIVSAESDLILDYIQQSLANWQHAKMAQYDSNLQQNELNDSVLNSIAEMGAALMSLSKNAQGEIRLYHPKETWSNVKFFQFEEVLP
ncbi:hypothetical protein PN36_26285 [Candidatus Thiomargarita nelsonii]|uniref:Uncharacterized protein n=1 Tax=Candidatus Thiomargarita nelsonii TaxID=1003181 RepID=A0A0A6PJD1_9GAMM|nr:hypothetical protein PN36_26285 [Candidatus Thiomargarita nelsonii]